MKSFPLKTFKSSPLLPQDQVLWYLTEQTAQPLRTAITTDVVIVGGGMAGLSAAQSFHQKGCQVVLIEKNYCGSGASGKSSGFITPNSELSLHTLITTKGPTDAKKLWDFTTSGVEHIRKNILDLAIDSDYYRQDTLIVANSARAFRSEVASEHRAYEQLHYESTLYTQDQLSAYIGSSHYFGALTYPNSFGINGYRYCVGMKHALQELGVTIYEETPAINITDHQVTTPSGTIHAEHIIVCTDYLANAVGTQAAKSLWDKVYHAQTCIMASAPLTDAQITALFPQGPYLVWDTDMVYQYYRLTGDNRLLLGGAALIDTYSKQEIHNNQRAIKKLSHYFDTKFPGLNPQFEYIWPGLIGISKDLLPLAGFDTAMPSVYYITAATGLSWAAALGRHSADRIIEHDTSFDHLFSPERPFPLGPVIQTIIGAPLTFALSNLLTTESV